MHIPDKQFIPGKSTITVYEGSFSITDRFDFSPGELDTGNKFLYEKELMGCTFVFYGDLLFHLFFFWHQYNPNIIARIDEGFKGFLKILNRQRVNSFLEIENGSNI